MARLKGGSPAWLARAIATTSLAVLSTSAFGADGFIDYGYAPSTLYSEQPLSTVNGFGEGWYLRGEIGPNLTYNNTERYDQIGTVETDDTLFEGVSFNVGAGKRINDFIRFDVTAGQADLSAYYRTTRLTAPTVTAGHPCFGTAQVGTPAATVDRVIDACDQTDLFELGAISGMANAYVDLPGAWGLRPFIGVGIGVSQVTWREEYEEIRCTPAQVDSEACSTGAAGETVVTPPSERKEVQYNLAWSVAAGLGYYINDGVTLEGLYRYTNYGGLESVVSPVFGTFDIGDLDTHTLNLGLRVELPSRY